MSFQQTRNYKLQLINEKKKKKKKKSNKTKEFLTLIQQIINENSTLTCKMKKNKINRVNIPCQLINKNQLKISILHNFTTSTRNKWSTSNRGMIFIPSLFKLRFLLIYKGYKCLKIIFFSFLNNNKLKINFSRSKRHTFIVSFKL